mmetsp:Transcript_25911/g.41615  ORF Transcript_25911/g.41615 Transcript_25911/m.41615 type:complete len:427 (-) Transcript_25911:42-1322(-)
MATGWLKLYSETSLLCLVPVVLFTCSHMQPHSVGWTCLLSMFLMASAHLRECADSQIPSPQGGAALLQVRSATQKYFNATKRDGSSLSAVDKSARPFSVPMSFTSLNEYSRPHAYKDAVKGECADVRGCTVGGEVLDCSAISSYQCSTSGEIATIEDGELILKFRAEVPDLMDVVECGEDVCEDCTKYKTCAGPSATTEPVEIERGQCVHWEYKSTGTFDWFEVYIGLYDDEGQKIGNIFERGAKSPWAYMQLPVLADSFAHLEFTLAAYDADGDGSVGADLHVRKPAYGKCLPEECLIKGPDTCCYTGDNAPLTESGYAILAECCSTADMIIYVRRVIDDEELETCVDGGIEGLAPWFTCEHALQSLGLLRDTLRKTRDGVLTPECPWLARKGRCADEIPEGCRIPHLPGTISAAYSTNIAPKIY